MTIRRASAHLARAFFGSGCDTGSVTAGPPKQRQHDIAPGLVVEPGRLVMLVERIVERELQFPVPLELPAGAHVGQRVAAQRVLVGDVVIRAHREIPACTETEATETAV